MDVPEDHLDGLQDRQLPRVARERAGRHVRGRTAGAVRSGRGADPHVSCTATPAAPRKLPLGASATLIAEHVSAGPRVAVIPAAAITQSQGQPALWAVRRAGAEPIGTVELIQVTVHGYRNDEVLVSGPPAGVLIVTAGVQKMAPGLKVALLSSARSEDPGKPPDEILQPHRMGAEPPRHRAVPDPRDRRGRRARLHQARSARRPELLRAVDDGARDLARRHGATDPGRGAQPHGEEVRAARPLREGRKPMRARVMAP